MKPTEIISDIKQRLPHTTQRLINTLGWDGALTFLRRNGREGGRTLYVPRKYNPKNAIFASMSLSDASGLIAELGGQEIEITSHKRMLASERYQMMANDFKHRGFSVRMISEKYNTPSRTVRWVLRKYELRD